MATSNLASTLKKVAKNVKEQKTLFEPVPYETADVLTSVTLLSSTENDIVLKALNVLAKFVDRLDMSLIFLYQNGIVPKLLELIFNSDLTILRFTLKLLGHIVTASNTAATELSLEDYSSDVKQVNHLFMTIEDPIIKEFSSQFLSHVVKSTVMASSLLKMGTLATILDVLKTNQDPDTQLNTLLYFNNILDAREAPQVLSHIAEFSPRTILCYLKHKIPQIRDAALQIIETLTSWRSGPMQELLGADHIVETLFKIILDDDYKSLHKRSFSVIFTCVQCLETATYFVKSFEFLQFCEWTKTCKKKYILPSASILTALTRHRELLQVLFDFSMEDAILSFFRTENELVFYKACEGVSNMSSHRFCCEKMVTPIVIECMIRMLYRTNLTIIPYHEIALKTLCLLIKRDSRTLNFIVRCEGLKPIMESLLRDEKEYTSEGISALMDMLYVFSSNIRYRREIMNRLIYEMLIQRFDESSEYSQKALLILNQYVNISEYRKYFIEFNGPDIVMRKITSTTKQQELINTLIFLQRNFLYKDIVMEFLWKGCIQILEKISDEIKKSVPIILLLLDMTYDLYLPLKFYKLGRLEITDHLVSRFYLINGQLASDFPFLEILENLKIVPRCLIYTVDFTANVDELTTVAIPQFQISLRSLTQKSSSLNKIRKVRRSSVSKNTSSKSLTQILHNTGETASNSQNESVISTIICRVPPPVNYGSISEDPYLPQYVEKLKSLVYHDKKVILCFVHQVKLLAKYVCDVLSGPEEAGTDVINNHYMKIHLAALKEKLGTSIIPIGYLRYGFYCERALLFKALAGKLDIPTTLVRGKNLEKNNLLYWNEIPITNGEPYINTDDTQKPYLTYAVVDLMYDIGNLMLVGSLEANKYCGLKLK